MPANIRVRCRYIDCKHLDGLHCGNTEIEFTQKKFCLAYTPTENEEIPEEDEELEEDELIDEDAWVEEEEEDDYEGFSPTDDED